MHRPGMAREALTIDTMSTARYHAPMKAPRVAYIALWFPKPSETFIFREVLNLKKKGLQLDVFTLYGELSRLLSPEMKNASRDVQRLGIPFLKRAPQDLLYWWKRNPGMTRELLRTVPVRRWRSFEVGGENLWSFFCGFTLARRFQETGYDLIHAAWANGPATAAWVASKLTGIPFSFTGRASDIYPPDGALKEKVLDSLFVTSDNMTNVGYLAGFADGDGSKIHGVYNGIPLEHFATAEVPMKPPYRLLALGRFDRIKAFEVLLRACAILKASGLPFHLTLAGDGIRKIHYRYLIRTLGLRDHVSLPGFVRYDRVSEAYCAHDVFVMSSAVHSTGERDGLPTVILEALMHRLPVVATDVCGIGEVIRDGITGYLVPEKNPEQLAQAVTKMVSDRNLAVEMAKRGQELVAREFDQERNHTTLMELFLREIDRSNRTHATPHT
jgi:colanic acid/amylovoran biosynthesis glycosyltransferase